MVFLSDVDAGDTDDGDDEGGGADDDGDDDDHGAGKIRQVPGRNDNSDDNDGWGHFSCRELLISATKVSLRMDTFLPEIEVMRDFGSTKTGLCKIPRFNSGALPYPVLKI